MSSLGPSNPSTPKPSNPNTSGACSSNGNCPISSLDSKIYSCTQKTRLTALKKNQDEETKELQNRHEMMRRVLVGMPEDARQEREQQLGNEMNILDRVHHYQREYPEVAPDVINSIYLSFLEVPEDDRPEFDEYLKFKQKLMDLENRIFKLPPDQLDQVLKDNGGSLAVVFLNVENNPLDILDEGGEGRLEVEEQQLGYREHDEEELEDEYEDEQEEEEEQEDEEREEGIQEDEELEEEYGDEEEMEKNQEDQEMYQEEQEMDYGHQQMDMVEDVQGEIAFAPIEHSVQYDANRIHQAAELAVHEEEEERLRKIRHRFRQENPFLMSLLESDMYQEDQEMDYGHKQMDMVEDVQEEIVSAPIEHSVQYDANQLIHQAAELAVHEEEEERLRKIRHRFRQENPILMSLLESE